MALMKKEVSQVEPIPEIFMTHLPVLWVFRKMFGLVHLVTRLKVQKEIERTKASQRCLWCPCRRTVAMWLLMRQEVCSTATPTRRCKSNSSVAEGSIDLLPDTSYKTIQSSHHRVGYRSFKYSKGKLRWTTPWAVLVARRRRHNYTIWCTNIHNWYTRRVYQSGVDIVISVVQL